MKASAETRAKIAAYLAAHQEEFLRDLAAWIAVPSVSVPGKPGEPMGEQCVRILRDALKLAEGYGFAVHNEHDLIGYAELPGSGEKSAGLWGHLDVVPEGEGWVRSPYAMTREGDVIFGRGVSDNKGPALAALYALRALKDEGIGLSRTVRMFFGTDEEKDMTDVLWYAANRRAPDVNIIPDSGFPVCIAEKGILEFSLVSNGTLSPAVKDFFGGDVTNKVPEKAYAVLPDTQAVRDALASAGGAFAYEPGEGNTVRVTVTGLARHAAHPYDGINAVRLLTVMLAESAFVTEDDKKLLAFLNAVNGDCDGTALGLPCEDEVSGRLTCVGSVLAMRGGHAVLTCNVRYPATGDGGALYAKVCEAARQAGYTAELLKDSKPNLFPKDDPMTVSLTALFNEVSGRDTKPYAMAGGTYARKLPNAFAYGPGGFPVPEGLPEMGGAHAHDEGTYFPNLLKAAEVLALALIEID